MSIRATGGYDGSNNVLTSVGGDELVPQPIVVTRDGGIITTKSPYLNSATAYNPNKTYFEQFFFYNDGAVHVKINGERVVYLRAGQNFECEIGDPSIFSFIVIDAGITFTWTGVYQ